MTSLRIRCAVVAASLAVLVPDALAAQSQVIEGADGATIKLGVVDKALQIEYSAPAPAAPEWKRTIFIALDTGGSEGSVVIPFEEKLEGSTVFLPFRANRYYAFQAGTKSDQEWRRTFENWRWGERVDTSKELDVKFEPFESVIRLPLEDFDKARRIKLVVYSKDFSAGPWGRLFGSSDPAVLAGTGDKYIPHYLEVDLDAPADKMITRKGRFSSSGGRPRIYQLLVRLFSNTNDTRKPNGTLEENGVGRFGEINDTAVSSLRKMGFTHIWLTGVVQQATGTDHSPINQPADDPDLLKGVAGSPYAIKDYFDVSPDYAREPERRIEEFKALIDRIHKHEMKALIDLVPNHVARSYDSDVKPEFNFGAKGRGGTGDDTKVFFDPNNNFFYLQPGADGPPLKLPTLANGKPVSPTCQVPGINCDGLFGPEKEIGRVTGNNVVSWKPALGDWYETVKLNYGFDFTNRSRREYPNASAPEKEIPDTWNKMDAVIEYWQSLGVDGFRCDMAHMVPPEFWSWAISRARERQRDVFFVAEAYDNDPSKVGGMDPVITKLNGGKSNVMFDLLNAGFDAVYDDPTYKAIKKVYDGPGWANDIDGAVPDEFIFDNSLRYAENHDEVRLAAKKEWGGVGLSVGPAVSAVLYGIGRGPAMVYNGQEVGEPAAGAEGFGGDDARTSIFDYWSMPELVKWVSGHKYDGGKLSDEQKTLRSGYAKLLETIGEPAFRDGRFMSLNPANRDNPDYGRIGNEKPSGHWIYSFLRYDPATKQRFLVVVNLHATSEMKDVRIALPAAATDFLELTTAAAKLRLMDRLSPGEDIAVETDGADLATVLAVGNIPPHTARFFEITHR